MPAFTLPPTFTKSFWTQDYRRGLETLHAKLEQGLAENVEIYNFIKARALAENDIGNALLAPGPTGARGSGFDADDGASLFMTFRALQTESAKMGEAHKAVAHELATLVADPFGQWATGHADRIQESKKVLIDGWLKAYEMATGDVDKLKHNYLTRSRRADEAEDDAKFAPGSDVGDKYTSSPKIGPTGGIVRRTASVSERITQRLKELRKGSHEEPTTEKTPLSPASPVFSAGKSEGDNEHTVEDIPAVPSKDKGKGKEIQETASPMAMSPRSLSPPVPDPKPGLSIPHPTSPMPPPPPSPLLLAGLSLPPQAVSQLLTRAASDLPMRSVRFPILGEYQDCFSGEEFVIWLKESVQGFGGSLDRAEDAARELTERDNVLRRIGELGNKFENSKEAFYQFRQKAFELHFTPETVPLEQQGGLSPVAENLFKRTNTFVSIVSKAVSSAAPSGTSEPPHVRARREAEDADRVYRVSVRKLDRQRLSLEEKIEDTLKAWQRWEKDRLRAVKTVLLQYQGTLANFPAAFTASLDRSSVLISSYQPENDLTALIERYRTGPFRPTPHIYESITHDMPDVIFGIDLRKWAGEGGWHALRAKEDQDHEKHDGVPNIVRGLLAGLSEAYEKLPNDNERRKAWIYDVPLPSVHHLREAINTLPLDAPIPSDLLAKYDAPVLASTLKLWMLELDPPLGLWEGWEDVRKLYPSVGAVAGAEVPEQERVEDLQVALLKLPKIHLLVLDAIIEHLRNLIDTTQEVDETPEVYTTKLALALGRTVLRPKIETELSIQDRHPTLLFIDLVQHYADILPKTIARKKRESLERPMPTRKRTKMVDQRLSRSRISFGADPQQLLAAQHAAQRGPPSRTTSPTRPVFEQTENSQASTAPPVTPVPSVPAGPGPSSQAPASSAPVSATGDSYVPPPRPTFAEPAPESDYVAPPRPRFVEPEPEASETGGIVVSPPTPVRSRSPDSPAAQSPVSPPPPAEGNAPDEDKPLASKTTLARSTSGETSRVRGPRIARGGPGRSAASGSTSPLARSPPGASPVSRPAGHSRGPSANSISSLSAVDRTKDYAPKKHGGKANAAIFSRRTQASDAEDNVLEK